MPCDELCSQQEAPDPGHYLQLTAAPRSAFIMIAWWSCPSKSDLEASERSRTQGFWINPKALAVTSHQKKACMTPSSPFLRCKVCGW